ncbi:MAG TPA: sterol desaturase family protein [Vicinamibacterales bacterium]|jgi:sterol desaturase/sphingolipid hydroxylase (fatty acid hydroxylase superfamily)|nr:sterol desaturase family protein [Vicinamibacterales bacterium]
MSWSTTFSRFNPGSLPLVGPVVVRVADWSKPQPGIAPVFERPPFLERFSMAHPAVPFSVFFPLGIYTAWRGWASGYTVLEVMGAYLLGLFIWTATEYAFHRGTFHHEPNSEGQVAYAYMMHGCHHAYPDDARRWVMPLIVSVPLSSAIYLLIRYVCGPVGNPIFGGFIHGYLCYDLLHYFIHRGRMPGRLGRYLRQYHLAHHYSKLDQHYGVTSPLWDVVFRTR